MSGQCDMVDTLYGYSGGERTEKVVEEVTSEMQNSKGNTGVQHPSHYPKCLRLSSP